MSTDEQVIETTRKYMASGMSKREAAAKTLDEFTDAHWTRILNIILSVINKETA